MAAHHGFGCFSGFYSNSSPSQVYYLLKIHEELKGSNLCKAASHRDGVQEG